AGRRKRAREEKRLMTKRVPGWLRIVNDAFQPIPERVAAINRVFDLAADGCGHARIIRTLLEEGVAGFGTSDGWTPAYVYKILNDRRVLGEQQPRDRKGKPTGEVIANYYPVIVSDETFALARAGQLARKVPRQAGQRDRKNVNVFQSLLVN